MADPAAQSVTGLRQLAAVGEAGGERHEGRQVVGAELQTPAAGERLETLVRAQQIRKTRRRSDLCSEAMAACSFSFSA